MRVSVRGADKLKKKIQQDPGGKAYEEEEADDESIFLRVFIFFQDDQ